MAAAGSLSLRAADAAAAPAQSQSAEPEKEDFGKYLIAHQDDLAPVFQRNADALFKQGLPKLLEMVGTILLLNIVIGWVFDIGIGYGFSYLIARAVKAKAMKALVYATGRLVIIVALTLIAGLVAYLVSLASPFMVLVVIGLIPLADIVVQTIWVMHVYRTNLIVSGLFYIWVLLAHVIAGALLSGSMAETRGASMLTQFIDQNVTAELKSATADTMQNTMAAEAARDKVQADVNAAQGRIDQANAQAEALRQEIDAKKNSDVLAYAQVCRTHAQGDLIAAQNQLNAFLVRFPSGSLTDAARAQLAMVGGELAAQAAEKKEQAAAADAAAAAAKADFLARASKDGVTLSEARQMILGKTRDEVTSLFGTPTETGSDRWGYERVITVNPMTAAKQGLAIYFSEGAVQSVDYYFGGAAGNAGGVVK
jgi:hypothetical protein